MNFFGFRKDKWEGDAPKDRKDHPKNETISEHLKHCTAKNCPFLRKLDIDAVDPAQTDGESEPQLITAVENGEVKTVKIDANKPISTVVFEKLAAAMSEMWAYANSLNHKKTDESIVKEVIERGLSEMHSALSDNDCVTKADGKSNKVVILPPNSEAE